MIPLSKADITDAEIKEVLEVLKSKRLALGPKLERFEKETAKFAGVKYAVAVNSGTSALHLIIRALGIGKSDGVITTPFSFISSSNCILYERANPVYVDIDKKTFNIDVSKIEQVITKKTKDILAVDIFSHPADWDELKKIAKKHALFLIEDSAEALGSEYKGKKCGSFGDAAIFAFYPNKQITTGEGGAILTNNKQIANMCKSMANQGRKVENGKWLEHIRLGYNYRLDEMSCALGIAQIARIDEILKKRSQVAKWYSEALKEIKAIELPYIDEHSKLSWFVYVVRLAENFSGEKRDMVIAKMAERGIACSNYFQPIHLQPFYKDEFGYKEGDYPVSEGISKRTFALPFFNNLTKEEVRYVAKNLKEVIHEF